MLDCKQISLFVGDKFIQVDQAVEEDAHIVYVIPQLIKRKMSFCRRGLDHIIHLTEQIDEEDRFVVQIFHSVNLLLIEVVHLMWCNRAIVIQIDHFEPVLQGSQRRLIFFREHEPDKVFVAHLAFLA